MASYLKWKDYCNKILSTIDNANFYSTEFKLKGLDFHQHGNELKGQCPFKEKHLSGKDNVPSFTVNLLSGAYFCNSCNSKGNVHTFYSYTRNLTRTEAWYELGDNLNFERPTSVDSRPDIDPGLPAKYHAELMKNTGPIRTYIKERRGLTDETLRRFVIGWDGERLTIPIYNEFSELVNIRRYKWNSYEDSCKMVNYEDEVLNSYGGDTLYGVENLLDPEIEKVLWCEGEWDRIVSEQNGIPAVTNTAGAGNFRLEWFKLLAKKKDILICYDNDDAGTTATAFFVENAPKSIALQKVHWPEDAPKKTDVTDVFTKLGYTKEKFLSLFIATSSADVPTVSLAASANARLIGKRVKVPVLVAGKDTSPYVYPKSVLLSCDNYNADNTNCTACALGTNKRNLIFTSNNPVILKLINCTDLQQLGIIKSLAGVPTKCNLYTYHVKEYANLETLHMVPKAETQFGFATHQEYVARQGNVIGLSLPSNKRYTLVGYMHADPNTQRATYIFDEAIPEKDLLDDLEITPELHERLSIFNVHEGQTVAQKINEIHADIERNITHVWNRRNVAIAADLVYHSVLNFSFQEQFIKRGWCECLIIGDSGQAKTTIVERIMEHYQCGELLSGESSRRTGLVYSIQQGTGSGSWTLIWGAMPLNDGGLITVDELSGMAEDDLAKMSDVRSSGIAKATGVVTGETTARTRMIFISNPRNGRQLKTENYGVMAILKLFGKTEDVRRLDFAIGVASGEVDTEVVNRSISEMPLVEHVYTSDLCKDRVMWAWSRKPNQVIFTPEASTCILTNASKMGKKYSSRVPLVEPADQRLKLARLSVSTAVMLYSTDDGTNVIVKPEHVEFVVEYLNSIYDTKALNYDRLSQDDFENSDTDDAAMQKLRITFLSMPFVTHDVPEIISALYRLNYFNRNTLEDATGLDRDELKNLLQFLIANAVVEKTGQDYRRTPMGLSFIEYMLTNPASEAEIVAARKKKYESSEV